MNNIEWKDFQVGAEEGIFSVTSSVSEIDKKNLNTEEGNIPYVTRTDRNNGIDMFVTNKQDKKYKTNKGNVITIGLDTQTAFYQPDDFYSGQNIQILSHSNLNEYNSLFLIELLKVQLKKFSWGGNGATLKRLNNLRIMLPVTNNEVNWSFIEEKGEEIYWKTLDNLTIYIQKKYNQLLKDSQKFESLSLENKKWIPFDIRNIFTKIQRGKRLTKANQIKGDIPYISSTALNNGVDGYIGNENDVRTSKQDITVANSGSVGNAFYHPYHYIASDHVHSLSNKEYNKYHYLFIVTLLNRLEDKYHFNYEINNLRLKSDKIMLPIDDDGNLDLDFMENYMKQVECKHIIKLINYMNQTR